MELKQGAFQNGGTGKPDTVALAALGVTYLARDHFPGNWIWVPEIGWYAASTGTMWKRLDTLAQIGVTDPVIAPAYPAALTNAFETLVYVGASNEQYPTDNGQATAITRRLKAKHDIGKANGQPLDAVVSATSGDTQAQWKTRYYDALLPTLTNKHIVFVGSLTGNDVSAAYTANNAGSNVANAWQGSAGDLALKAENKSILAALSATGAVVMPQTLSFRDYGLRTRANEDAGAKLFNTNLVIPNLRELTPAMFAGDDLYFDWYTGSTGIYPTGYETASSPVHLTAYGYAIWRNWMIDAVAARIKGQAPVKFSAGFALPAIPQPARVVSGNVSSFTPLYNAMYNTGAFKLTPAASAQLLTLDGYRLNSVTLTSASTGFAQANNGTTSNTGNATDSLLNDSAKTFPWSFADSAGIVPFLTFNGLNPNQQVRFKYVSCRNALATDQRWIELSSDNFATVASSVNGATPTGVEPAIQEVVLTADGNGKLVIYVRAKAGSTYGYMNGFEIWPL